MSNVATLPVTQGAERQRPQGLSPEEEVEHTINRLIAYSHAQMAEQSRRRAERQKMAGQTTDEVNTQLDGIMRYNDLGSLGVLSNVRSAERRERYAARHHKPLKTMAQAAKPFNPPAEPQPVTGFEFAPAPRSWRQLGQKVLNKASEFTEIVTDKVRKSTIGRVMGHAALAGSIVIAAGASSQTPQAEPQPISRSGIAGAIHDMVPEHTTEPAPQYDPEFTQALTAAASHFHQEQLLIKQ